MRRFLTLFTVLMLTSIFAFAQDRLVTGKVVDDKGNGVPAASIKIAGTNKGTSTDSDGSFAIKVKKGEQLVISSTGYESKTVPTDGQSFVGVTIATTSATMQEVVVTTATGQIRQKSSVGFSTATVKGSELTQAKATNIAQGLTGKVSGATFLQTNSGVFQDTRITLRGIRSLTGNNQPMLIVDGVPISLGYLNSINPNDIATADILKSAGSTAIYGSDGVNGAIVITTRRGSKNRPQVSVSHAVQFESINSKIVGVLAMPRMVTETVLMNHTNSKVGEMNLMVPSGNWAILVPTEKSILKNMLTCRAKEEGFMM